MDFYVDYRIARQLRFRFGQYKVPFTRYRIQSFKRLTFVDWAIVTEYFGAERQMGFAFHNGYEMPPTWGYAFGVLTGVNARASHAIGLPRLYGEIVANPSDLSDPDPRAKFHPELFWHVSYNARGIRVQSDSDEERQRFRYSAGLSAAWDLDPTPYQDFSFRLASELLTKYRGVSLCAAGYTGFAETGDQSHTDLAMVEGLFQTAYRISKRCEISLRYAVVQFEDVVTDDAYQRAQQLIARAERVLNSSVEKELAQQYLSDITAQYKNAGKTLREQEMTVGLNVYIVGHSLKWQNDAGWLRHSLRNETRTDYIARSQFQLTF